MNFNTVRIAWCHWNRLQTFFPTVHKAIIYLECHRQKIINATYLIMNTGSGFLTNKVYQFHENLGTFTGVRAQTYDRETESINPFPPFWKVLKRQYVVKNNVYNGFWKLQKNSSSKRQTNHDGNVNYVYYYLVEIILQKRLFNILYLSLF